MFNSIWRLIVSPNQFFTHERQDPSLRGPTVIVALTGIFYGLSALVTFPLKTEQFQAEVAVYLYTGAAVSAVMTFLMTVLFWVFYSGAFFTVAIFIFESESDFRDILSLTGWGFIGLLFTAILSMFMRIYRAQQFSPTSQSGAAGQLQLDPVLAVVSIIVMIAFFWSVFLWQQAIQRTFYLPLVKSLITVSVPIVITIIIFVIPGAL